MGDDAWIPEGEFAYAEDGEEKGDDAEGEQESEHEFNEEEEEAAGWAAHGSRCGIDDPGIACSSGYYHADDVSSCGEP